MDCGYTPPKWVSSVGCLGFSSEIGWGARTSGGRSQEIRCSFMLNGASWGGLPWGDFGHVQQGGGPRVGPDLARWRDYVSYPVSLLPSQPNPKEAKDGWIIIAILSLIIHPWCKMILESSTNFQKVDLSVWESGSMASHLFSALITSVVNVMQHLSDLLETAQEWGVRTWRRRMTEHMSVQTADCRVGPNMNMLLWRN